MINLIVNGNSYSYPQPGDKANTGWGSQATNWASAVTAALTALGLGGTLTPTPNAVVDISSTTKGILIPRLTTTQRNAITSPATSLLIFNTTLGVFQYYTGSAWITIGAKIPDNVQFDGTLTVNGSITAVGAATVGTDLGVGGNANITGKALTGNGLVSAPTHSFINDPDSGLYRISENKIGFAANGIRQGEFGVGYGGFTGNIIQCVESLLTSTYSITTAVNNVLITTGIVGQITTKLNNSNILILINQQGTYQGLANYIYSIIYRNTTSWLGNVSPVGTSLNRKHILGASLTGTLNPIIQLDSPSVSAGTTLYYGNSVSNNGTGSTVTINYDPAGFSASRAFASIVLMEIAT